MKPKVMKVLEKSSVAQKSKLVLRRTLHQDVWLIIAFFSSSQTNLVSELNLVLIEQFLPQFIYLFTFRYSVYLEVHPVLLSFSIRTSESFDEAKAFFRIGLQPQNFPLMFLFSINHSYLLTAKITPEVYGMRLSQIFKIPSISYERPNISIEILT